ncbi:MAG: hypothetical protein DI607_01385 [Sphingomonas hengshuiensis]|nr:MAG: hypothetical protein DI607_01385 [Sphingomonas hengshuiensis]
MGATNRLFSNPVPVSGPDAVAAAVAAIFAAPAGRGQQAEGAQLDKRGATLTPAASEEVKEQVSVTRWRLKHKVANLLRDVPAGASVPGVCKCGTAGHQVEQVSLTLRGARPGVSGVFYCDSPWLCPTCAPRRAAQRAEKVEEVFDATEARGGSVVFVTLTVHHGRRDALADLKALVSDACRKARQGKGWRLAVERYGIAGVLVGPEVTWSPANGWHFHLHLAVPMLGPMDRAEEGGEWIIERYRSYILKAGGRALRKAQDVQVCWRKEDLADYLAKGSAAWEVASAGATKKGKKGLTPWDLAAKAGLGDARSAGLFREYAAAMPGTRSCVVSKALADKLGLKPSDDDDAPGVEEAEEDAEVVGTMEPPRWHRVLRRGHAADVLSAVAQRRPWPEIDALVGRLLHEDQSEAIWRREEGEYCPLEIVPLPKPPKEYAPALSELVLQTIMKAECQFRGRRGPALQVVLEEHRAIAAAKGLPFFQPPFSEVWQALAT